ncbi:serine hydrolase domain-containing protein [Rudaea sp.]|uniref:serine hydrolase domain-containing protein n=1 Tax=Rudaea sp. TaxID=2136325 RepID=UPI002ED0CC66
MRLSFMIVALVVAIVLSAKLQAAVPASKADVARYAGQLLADNYAEDAPGAAVIVARGDEVLFRGTRGMGNIERAMSLSADDMFDIGSITKQFAAAGLLKLVETGKVSLDDPLSKFVKGYPSGEKITVLELLNHTSGIKNYTDDGDLDAAVGNKMTTLQLIDTFKNQKPEFAPGTSWAYNNSGYLLVGAVIEAASGTPWCAYLQRTLFQPLGLNHTGCGADPVIAAKQVRGYTLIAGKLTPARLVSLTAANGALVSTVDDLQKWNRALHEGRVLKHDSYRRMITPVGKAVPEQYGFGVYHTTLRGREMIGHSGLISGFRSYLLYLPQSRISVAVLQNKDVLAGVSPAEIARKLAAFAIGDAYPAVAPIAVDTAVLHQAEGVFGTDPPGSSYARVVSARVLRVIRGKLTIARTGGVRSELIPIAADTYQSSDSLDRLHLERGGTGAVTALRFFPWGEDEGVLLARMGATPPPALVVLSHAALERVVGNYSGGGAEFRVSVEDEQLKVDPVGPSEPGVTLLAESPNTFTVAEVDGTVVFDPAEGTPRIMVLHQGSETVEFKRKP